MWSQPVSPDNSIQRLTDAGVGFSSVNEGIDTNSATRRLMLGILGSFAEFERERIRERVVPSLAPARSQGKRLVRPRTYPAKVSVPGGTLCAAQRRHGACLRRQLRSGSRKGVHPPTRADNPLRQCLDFRLDFPASHRGPRDSRLPDKHLFFATANFSSGNQPGLSC